MLSHLRAAYGRVRRIPGVGSIVSRGVWAVKGALGAPVRWPASHGQDGAKPGGTVATPEARLSAQLAIAIAAVEGLWARSSPVSNIPSSTTRPRPEPRRPIEAGARLTISVVVNTYDRAAHLRQTLQALGQLRHPAFEVIVVNGPSRDDTHGVLAEFAGVRTARCPEANLAMSRNIGLAMATGEVVAFIDDDAVPEPDWLDALERAYDDPSVGGVGGFIRDRSGVGFQCKVVVSDRLGDNQVFDSLEQAALEPHAPGAARYLSLTGANVSFRRAALDAIGGFDEAYSYFLEETDACLRLVDAGWDLAVAPDAEVHHRMAESALRQDDQTPKSLLPNVRSTAYFAMRNGAPHLGLAAATDHLARHVEALKTDARWRLDHGVIGPDLHGALLVEIDAGLTEGVRTAFATPERRLSPFTPRPGGAERFAPLRRSMPADRLRLCLLSQEYCAGPTGGIGVWTRALAQGLSRAGHEVTVVSRAETDTPTVSYEDGVWVHRVAPASVGVPASRPPWFHALPPSIADYSSALSQEVERATPRRRFDVVMGPIWDLEPAACLAEGAVPTVVSLHTPYALSLAHKPAWRADATFRARHVAPVIAGERAMLACAPHILANSSAIVADLAKAYDLPDLAARAVTIPHGLPDRRPAVQANPVRASATPSPKTDTVEILFVGRLEPRKGADVLLAAAATVLKEAPNARLTLVGDDSLDAGHEPLRRTFERRWAGTDLLRRVAFTGLVDDAELTARYAACDIFTAPSRYESFGLVFVEAMMFAKPCVGCAVGGIGEVVTEGETGLLVAPSDADALATALLALVRDPQRRNAMGEAGRRRYEQRFTADAMVQAAERYFRQMRDARAIAAPASCVGSIGRAS